MSKKNRRKKNNKTKKNFHKNLFIKEEVEARMDLEAGLQVKNKEVKKEKVKESLHKKEKVGIDLNKARNDLILISQKSSKFLNKKTLQLKSYYRRMWTSFKKWNNIFCDSMTCQDNLKRDLIIISILVLIITLFFVFWGYGKMLQNKLSQEQEAIVSEEEPEVLSEVQVDNIKTIQDKIDTTLWKEYTSNWYGFKIKYPQAWLEPKMQPLTGLSQEAFRLSFMARDVDDEIYQGFDVVVYDVNRTKEFNLTKEFPKIKNQELKDAGQCENINGHLIETGDYPAEEIYISPADDCYHPTLFFSVTKDQYIYNIVPVLRKDVVFEGDPMIKISDDLPEFFAVVSQFENSEIIRPKPKPAPVKITAPEPASYKVDNFGRRVCGRKNDKPSKSDKGKGKHLDMECCLDPDEYPNPHCYYDPNKYGKYLK